MEVMSIEEFKNMSNIEIIKEYMNRNNGYITSKDLGEIGIHRMYLKMMHSKGIIKKVGTGIYVDSNKVVDDYFVLNTELSNIIYSHMTALYFHGLKSTPEEKYDITVLNNYYNYKIKNHNVYYVNMNVYGLGLEEVITPSGNMVRCYDKERCICDIIRSISRMDLESVKNVVKEYLKLKDKNLSKVYKYAERLGILKEVSDFINIMK